MPPDAGHPELAHSDAAGWALGALDPADAEAFQIHLRDCAECQATMTGFEAVTRALKCRHRPSSPLLTSRPRRWPASSTPS